MTTSNPVDEFFAAYPSSRQVFIKALTDPQAVVDGVDLVDNHMNPMIDWTFGRIWQAVNPSTLTAQQALTYIRELSVFARYNAIFLRRAAASVDASVFELAQEFRRNALEEGGERGKLPAHYTLYTSALLRDLDVLVNAHVPAPSTQMLILLHDVIVNSFSASTICGAYYATEAVAIDETKLLQAITNRYAETALNKDPSDLPHLGFYYDLHLSDSPSASGDILGVEQAHQDGIGDFIRQYSKFNLRPAEICDGYLQVFGAMAGWWYDLVERSSELSEPT
jgi:hypothetical protein